MFRVIILTGLILISGCSAAKGRIEQSKQKRAEVVASYYGYAVNEHLESNLGDLFRCGTHSHLAKVRIGDRTANICDRRKGAKAFIKFD